MINLKVTDKVTKIDNHRLYAFLAIGVIGCALLLFVYRDVTVFLTPLACFIVIFVILILPPTKKTLEIDADLQQIVFDDDKIDLTKTLSWGMTDLGDQIELVIRQQNLRTPFYYFYIDINEPKLEQLVLEISQLLPFEEGMPMQDVFHNYLRIFGLK